MGEPPPAIFKSSFLPSLMCVAGCDCRSPSLPPSHGRTEDELGSSECTMATVGGSGRRQQQCKGCLRRAKPANRYTTAAACSSSLSFSGKWRACVDFKAGSPSPPHTSTQVTTCASRGRKRRRRRGNDLPRPFPTGLSCSLCVCCFLFSPSPEIGNSKQAGIHWQEEEEKTKWLQAEDAPLPSFSAAAAAPQAGEAGKSYREDIGPRKRRRKRTTKNGKKKEKTTCSACGWNT